MTKEHGRSNSPQIKNALLRRWDTAMQSQKRTVSIVIFAMFLIAFFVFLQLGRMDESWQQIQQNESLSKIRITPAPALSVDIRRVIAAGLVATRAAGEQIHDIAKSGKLGKTSKGSLGISDSSKESTTAHKMDDPLTNADLMSHVILTDGLHAMIPGIRIVSEEKDATAQNSIVHPDLVRLASRGVANAAEKLLDSREVFGNNVFQEERVNANELLVWIDPLDATKEFTEGLHEYVTVMMCVAYRGQPIAGIIHYPFTDRTVWGWVGHSQGARNDSSASLWHGHDSDILRHTYEFPSTNSIDKTVYESSDKHSWKQSKGARVVVSRSHAGSIRTQLEQSAGDIKIEDVTPAGGAGYKINEVLADRQDVYIHSSGIKKWDICAGDAILRAEMQAQNRHSRAPTRLKGNGAFAKEGGLRDWAGHSIKYDSPNDVKLEGGLVATRSANMYEAIARGLSETSLSA